MSTRTTPITNMQITTTLLGHGFEECGTGGGCLALRKDLERHYILITDGDYGLPGDDDQECCIGLYLTEDDDEALDEVIGCPASDLEAKALALVAKAGAL